MGEPKMFEATWNNNRFQIVEDLPEVGWYLYVYDKDERCLADHLQNDLPTIIEFAEEEYGIPQSEWQESNEKMV